MTTTEAADSISAPWRSTGQSDLLSRDLGIELYADLRNGESGRLEAIRSRAFKLKTLLAMLGYAPEFATTAEGDVLWLVREQIDVIEALAGPEVAIEVVEYDGLRVAA